MDPELESLLEAILHVTMPILEHVITAAIQAHAATVPARTPQNPLGA